MIARRIAAAGALALAATASVPALASAAPVQPTRALLTADEFPAGTTDYTLENRSPSAGLPSSSESPKCSAQREDLDQRLRGITSANAVALRRANEILVYVLDRPVTTQIADLATHCAIPGMGVATPRAVPGDLARVRARVVTTSPDTIQGWADVRGATVSVNLFGIDGAAADREAFWQLFRAQIAKVERQP
ncbi:hypothetical protein AXK57_12835 [Tsukamurella pulmonis]|nr:hypothetical protein AXK57_12835 [Tsukamurella pulmonis]RDH11382.1 hypothetical protein DVB88_12995 [Tsukamurella pulmonis]